MALRLGLTVMLLTACSGKKGETPVPARPETPAEYWNGSATISRLEWLRINLEIETVTSHGNCPDDVTIGQLPPCVSFYYLVDDATGTVTLYLTAFNEASARTLDIYTRSGVDTATRKAKALFGRDIPVKVSVSYLPSKRKK